MDLNRLRTFKVLTETRSFNETAKILCVTQSAISQQMKLLQEELGYPLVQKINGNLELTPTGRALYEKINHPLSILCDELEAPSKEERAHYKIMGPYNYLSEVFAIKVKKISPHDLVQFFIGNSEQCLEALHEGKIDFAIVSGPVKSKDVVSHVLLEEHMLLVSNPHLLIKPGQKLPVVGMEPQLKMFHRWKEVHKNNSYDPTCFASIESIYGIINFILKFPCAGVVPEYLVSQYLKDKKLVLIESNSRKLRNNISICMLKKNKSSASAKLFKQIIVS